MAILANAIVAENGRALYDSFWDIYQATIEGSQPYSVTDAVIDHKDFKLFLRKGTLIFTQPITLDNSEIVYGAFFVGDGSYRINPTEILARQQLDHATDQSSLKNFLTRAVIMFSPKIYNALKTMCGPSKFKLEKNIVNEFHKAWKHVGKKENYYFSFETLRNLYEPSDKPFLFVNLQQHSLSFSEYYIYNPLDTQEIKIYKNKVKGPMFKQFMKTLCSYSCLLDSTGTKCKIVSEPQVKTLHNKMNINISDQGDIRASVNIKYEVLKPPAQLLRMLFHNSLLVDSIIDSRGAAVNFVRYKKADNKDDNLFLFLNQPAGVGDSLDLVFYYHGPVLELTRNGRVLNQSSFSWYPAYVERDSATADIFYTVPIYDDYTFESSGTLLETSNEGYYQTTIYKVDEPELYLYFDYVEK